MSKITVAVAQICSGSVPSENYDKAEQFIEKAAQKGAQLIVFPENMNFDGTYDPSIREPMPGGEGWRRMSAAAKKYGIWVHSGSIMEMSSDERKRYNTSLLFSPRGEMVAKYRKLHLCDMSPQPGKVSKESNNVIPGKDIVVADTELGKIGMAICYDIRFPELYRLMADKGARIICQPACFGPTTGSAHWEVMLRSVAVLNHCYVLACDQCGTHPNGKQKWGHSMIIDPWGTVIAEAGQEREALLVAEIDPEYCEDLKNRLGCLTNRRADVYTLEELV